MKAQDSSPLSKLLSSLCLWQPRLSPAARCRKSASIFAAQCHPFFTGKQKFVDTAGRVKHFSKKFGGMYSFQKPTWPPRPQLKRRLKDSLRL